MELISLFNPAFSKTPAESISVQDFLNYVKLGKWKKEVEDVRKEPDVEKRKLLKKSVSGVTISGTFSQRNEQSILKHSGFLCVDIDGYTNRDQLLIDKYTFGLFASISNSGIAVIVKVDSGKHKESFRWIQEYYYKSYGIPVDPAPSSVASLRFISYDPNTFINTKAIKCKSTIKQNQKINSLPIIFPKDKVGEMVREAVNRGINIAESYHEYLTLGFSIASGFGEDGRSYFHAIAGISDKYNSQHCEKQYDFCMRNPTGGISVGSFYYLLKKSGINFPENNNYENAIRLTAIQKKSGQSKEETIKLITSDFKIESKDAIKIIEEVHKRQDITLTSIASDPEKLISSLVAWVSSTHPVRKNLITCKLENANGDLLKEKFNTIYLHARAAFNTPNVTPDLIERILFSDFTPQYHPLKEYIKDNRHRNTKGNIERLIKSVKSPTLGYELFIKKWLLGIPSTIEGHPVRLFLALNGPQLNGKTEWFRRLLPDKLKKYYAESKLTSGKDDELLMCQKLVICDDEMGGKTRHDELYFKMILSKVWFSLREPYGRGNMDYKRLSLLCGTSNEKAIINDPTGNTRILPVEVESIDFEMYNGIDKDELFMEIIREYESGIECNFTREELKVLDITSKEFENIKIEQELILKYFLPKSFAEGNGFVEEMTATEIKSFIEIRSFQKILNMRVFGMELKSIFGESQLKKIGGKTVRKYLVVKIQDNNSLSSIPISQTENFSKIEEDFF